MKRLGIVLAVGLLLITAGCSRIKFLPLDQAHMNGAAFLSPSAKVKAGSPIKFFNDSNVTHILVVGQTGKWVSTSGAPTELNNADGQIVTAGKEVSVVFPTPGTYTITCTVHPAMLITITVS
jgi:plastocyanin